MKRFASLAVSLLVLTMPVLAKRSAPPDVAPVISDGIEYSAPNDPMGWVIATEVKTRKEIYRRRIYQVPVNPDLERDVQDVFIKALEVKRNFLLVTNERGEMYALDLSTRTVAPVATH